eukprot:GHVL01017030.1.p1 GENE.GHVL01017030.1~~GHVL01017030.1.p1  ORF type:complete len:728 (-),score=71.61 GHVL01017030.1:23-2170(-)
MKNVKTIFFPLNGINEAPGYLVGWLNSDIICVACLACHCDFDTLSTALSSLFLEEVGKPPQVLGRWVVKKEKCDDEWLCMYASERGPCVSDISYQIVIYEQPDQNHFLSTHPINLVKLLKKANIMEPETKPYHNSVVSDLDRALNQINHSQTAEIYMKRLLLQTKKKKYALPDSPDDECCLSPIPSLFTHLKCRRSYPTNSFPIYMSYPIFFLNNFFNKILERTAALFYLGCLSGSFVATNVALCLQSLPFDVWNFKFSTLLSQFLLRVRATSQWPFLLYKMKLIRQKGHQLYLANKLMLYSSVTLVLLDIFVGIVAGVLLYGYPDVLLSVIHKAAQFLHIDVLRRRVDWLMAFPAGLKLNRALNEFIGMTILVTIDIWNELTTLISPIEPFIVRFLGVLSFTGFSLLLAITCDILNLCTLHIFYIYLGCARLLNLMTATMYSLFNLFKGTKWNVLRQRVDTMTLETEQTLVGTILFTVFMFLFPTVLVFYVSFLLIWLFIVGTQCVLSILISFFNHFPLYLVVLHIQDPFTLSGGITFNIIDENIATYVEIIPPPPKIKEPPQGVVQSFVKYFLFFFNFCFGPLHGDEIDTYPPGYPNYKLNKTVIKRKNTGPLLILRSRPMPLSEKSGAFLAGLKSAFYHLQPLSVMKSVMWGRVIYSHRVQTSTMTEDQVWAGVINSSAPSSPFVLDEIRLQNFTWFRKAFAKGDWLKLCDP